MKPADKAFLDGLRKSVCVDVPQDHWDLVVKAVDDAGDIRDVNGYARTIILEGVEKAKFSSRSEAGRYAANMRWKGQGDAATGLQTRERDRLSALADIESNQAEINKLYQQQTRMGAGEEKDMARIQGVIDRLEQLDRNLRSKYEQNGYGTSPRLKREEGTGFDSPKMKEQLAYEAKRDQALGAKAADIADAVSERDEPVAPKAGTPGPDFDSRSGFKGPKYQGYRPVKQVAIDVRRDLKDAVANGELPQGLKFSVKSDNRGTNAVRVRVSGLPKTRDDYGRLTGESKAVYDKVDSIVNAYNRDNSDIMTDYFDVDYYGTVQLDD